MKTLTLLFLASPLLAQNGLTAVNLTGNQIQLNWLASTLYATPQYLVFRCAGKGCTNFSQVATVAGLTYTDSGLSHYTYFSYQVQATDGTNFSSFGRVAGVYTVDLVLQSTTGDRCTAVASMTSTPLVTFTCNTNNPNLGGGPGLRLTSTANNVNNVTNGVGYAVAGIAGSITCLVAINEDPVNSQPASLDSATVLTLGPSSIAYSCALDCTGPAISGVWTLAAPAAVRKPGLLLRIWKQLKLGRPK